MSHRTWRGPEGGETAFDCCENRIADVTISAAASSAPPGSLIPPVGPIRGADIVFAVLPFSQVGPALDASTIAALASSLNITTSIAYLNRHFAWRIGHDFYDAVASQIPLDGLFADWIFRDLVFGFTDPLAYLEAVHTDGYIRSSHIPRAINAREIASKFIDDCVDAIPDRGVSTLFLVDTFAKRDAVAGQLMASLALAKRLKERTPAITIVLVSPSAEGEMGKALSELTFLDYVCETSAPEVIEGLVLRLAHGSLPASKSQNLDLLHQALSSDSSAGSRPMRRQLSLPIPDFDDYFALKYDGLGGDFHTIPMQTSRGCWWAERSHCGFCGLNGRSIKFQSKAPRDSLRELDHLVERYAVNHVELNDLIIDPNYLIEFFQVLSARRHHDLSIFCETRTSLSYDQLQTLSLAGVRELQAGIESLSQPTLRRIGKGTSVTTNIRFLEACKSLGVRCYWNYLHSTPGETAKELLSALPVISQSTPLQPPASFGPSRVARFSPYHKSPSRYGLVSARPRKYYSHVFSGSGLDLHSLAYYFDYDEPNIDIAERSRAITRMRRSIQVWQQDHAI